MSVDFPKSKQFIEEHLEQKRLNIYIYIYIEAKN